MARPSRFTNAEIVGALREVESGVRPVTMCRRLGITQTTFYRWRKQFGHGADGQTQVVRELRAENQKLKQIVANFLLEKL